MTDGADVWRRFDNLTKNETLFPGKFKLHSAVISSQCIQMFFMVISVFVFPSIKWIEMLTDLNVFTTMLFFEFKLELSTRFDSFWYDDLVDYGSKKFFCGFSRHVFTFLSPDLWSFLSIHFSLEDGLIIFCHFSLCAWDFPACFS